MTADVAWLAGLAILVPIVAAICPFVAGPRYPRADWSIAVVGLLATLVVTLALLVPVARGTTVRYAVGAIPAAYGIELVVDAIAGTIALLALLVILGAVVHTRRAGPRGPAFASGVLLLAAGTVGIAFAGDLFNLFVFLEIAAIASYALIASAPSRVATYATFKYLVLGTIGAALYLLGVAYAFVATGTLNMAATAAAFAAVGHTDPIVVTSFVLVAVGLAIKVALFPVHTWLADAHAAAPDAISAVVSGLLPAIAVYALARVALTVYTIEFFVANPVFGTVLLVAGLATVVAGSLFAIVQAKVKLLLAYSTVAQMGLAVVGVAIATDQALYGALLQLVGHGIVKAALFILAGVIAVGYGARRLDEYAGLARTSPVLAAAFALLGLSLIGLPPTVGFMAKYYIVLGAIEAGAWLAVAVVIASALLTAAYIVPIIDRLYFRRADETTPDRRGLAPESVAVVAIAVALAIALGLLTVPLEPVVAPAIEVMLA